MSQLTELLAEQGWTLGKNFDVEKFLWELLQYIPSFDINAMNDIWIRVVTMCWSQRRRSNKGWKLNETVLKQ